MLYLQTERLDLIACPEPAARSAKSGIRHLESVIGVKVAAHWMNDEGAALLNYYAHLIRQTPNLLGYGLWLIIHRDNQMMFGTAGFKGLPDEDGMIEIGYGIDPAYRRQGYTFETAQALVGWGFAQPGVETITAECLTSNLGSIRVLEKLGMRRTGLVGSYIKWRLPKPNTKSNALR